MQSIQKTVNRNSPEAYQQVLDAFFYFTRQNGDAVFNNTHVKPAYLQASEEKFKAENTHWKSFLEELQKMVNIQRIRNWSHDSMHTQKVLITLDVNANSGICLFLSHLGDYAGCYYIDGPNSLKQPVFGHEAGYMSYLPMNDGHIRVRDQILKLVEKHFPGFVLFDNDYAEVKVEQLQRYEAFYSEIPMFHAIFDNNLTGLI